MGFLLLSRKRRYEMETLTMKMFEGKEEKEVINLVEELVSWSGDCRVQVSAWERTVGLKCPADYGAVDYTPRFHIDEELFQFLNERLVLPTYAKGLDYA
jgi:hypothetical protein